ncbi:MAG: hypothetical protein JSS65_06885 [Armatimonadetes bacterium]|nr:hypothetical protein [Armatimonadota bacterium]
MVQAAVSSLTARAGVRMLVSGPDSLVAAADLGGGLSMYADRREVWRRTDLDLDAKTRDAARVTDMAFDLDGETLVVVGSHGVVALDAKTGETKWARKRRWIFGFLSDLPLTVCAGPDSDYVVAWSSGRVERMDSKGLKKRHWIDNSAPESMVYVESLGILCGADGYSVRSWDASVWPPVEQASLVGRWVKVVAVPGTECFVARRLDAVFCLDVRTLDVLWSMPGPVAHPAMAVSPDGALVAWVGPSAVFVHDVADGKLVHSISPRSRPLSVAGDADGWFLGLADGSLEFSER